MARKAKEKRVLGRAAGRGRSGLRSTLHREEIRQVGQRGEEGRQQPKEAYKGAQERQDKWKTPEGCPPGVRLYWGTGCVKNALGRHRIRGS